MEMKIFLLDEAFFCSTDLDCRGVINSKDRSTFFFRLRSSGFHFNYTTIFHPLKVVYVIQHYLFITILNKR